MEPGAPNHVTITETRHNPSKNASPNVTNHHLPIHSPRGRKKMEPRHQPPGDAPTRDQPPGGAPTREELRALKAARKAAKRTLRETHRLENIAKSLATQAKRDETLREAAAESAAAAEAAAALAPDVTERWRELVNDPKRIEAARLCSVAVQALRSKGPKPAEDSAEELLRAMKAGTQQASMFENEGACSGYIARKFAERALLIFTALHVARQRVPWASRILEELAATAEDEELERVETSASGASPAASEPRSIVSIGGGPGCCLFGWVLAEQLLLPPAGHSSTAADDSSLSPRPMLESWDWVSDAWAPWASLLNGLGTSGSDGRLVMRQCDITQPFAAQPHVHSPDCRRERVFIFSYVLTETRHKWQAFVQSLYEAAQPGALFLCAEPTRWQADELLRLVTQLSAPRTVRHAWLDVRTNAAPPSVLLLEKPRNTTSCSGSVS